jgi:hypothetical protein
MFKVSHEKQKDLLAVTDVALIVRCRVDLDDLERSKTRWKVNDNLRHRKWSETIWVVHIEGIVRVLECCLVIGNVCLIVQW